MSNPQPKSKITEVESFMSSYHGMIEPNRIQFIRWLKDAQALRSTNPATGYMMEGLVYRTQGNLHKSLNCIENSYRLDWLPAGNNYAFILSAAGEFEKATEVCLRIIEAERTNTTFLEQLVSIFSYTLDTDSLKKGISLFLPTNPDAVKVLEKAKLELSSYEDMMYNLNASNITVETYRNFQRVLSKVRNSNYMGTSEISIDYENNEAGSFLVVEESLANASIDDCLRMNDELIDAIIDDDYSFEEYRKIIFNFRPVSLIDNYEVTTA